MKITLPGVSDDDNRTLGHLLEQLDAKQTRNLLRGSLYDGKHAIRQVGTVIPPQYYRLATVLGWVPKGVDFLARRCNLDQFVWPDGDLSGLGYGEVFEDNHLSTEVSSAIISSLIHGVSFLVNTRGQDGEPSGLIHVKDATSATGDWNARTRRLDNLLSVTGRDELGQPNSLALYLDGVTITAEKDNGWQVDRQQHPWGVPAEPLVYKPRAGRPFGMSRISRPAMALQDMALRTIIRMEANADVYSFPQMILLGADNGIFKNPDGSMKASWQVALGRVFALPDDPDREGDPNARAEVKQFSAASPQPHADQLEVHAGLFAGEMDLPVTALGVQAKTNTTTADGSDNAERQLVAEAEGATDDWSRPLRRTLTRALAMQQGLDEVPAEWRTIAPKWRSPIYLSRAAEADAGAKQIGAAPWLAETEVGLKLLGLSPQDITLAMSEKRRMGGSAALRALTQAATAQGVIVPPADLLEPGATDGLES